MNRLVSSLGVRFAIAMCLTACSSNDVAERIQATAEAVMNGAVIPEANSGVVRLTEEGTCTGTLLRNRWVLTAARCVALARDRQFGARGVAHGVREGVEIAATALDASGRTLVAGRLTSTAGGRMYLARLGRGGALDPTFGSGGELTLKLTGASDEGVLAITLQGAKIALAGYAVVNGKRTFALARVDDRGKLDEGFDEDGKVLTDFRSRGGAVATAITVDGSSRLVVAGYAEASDGSEEFALARYKVDGSLDETFGEGGRALTRLRSQATGRALAVAVDAGGRVVAAGRATQAGETMVAVARYRGTDGALDVSFADEGKRLIDAAGDAEGGALTFTGSKPVVAGRAGSKAAVWRLDESGAIDTGFGAQGMATLSFVAETSARAVGIARAADGRLRVAASVQRSSGGVFGYGELSASGQPRPDRAFPDASGAAFEAPTTVAATGLAVAGGRVVIVGTTNAGAATSRAVALSLLPDRAKDLTFSSLTATMGAASSASDRVYLAPNDDDVALVHLATGLPMNGDTTRYRFAGFVSDVPGLLGDLVTCRGYGRAPLGGPTDTLRSGLSRAMELSAPSLFAGVVLDVPGLLGDLVRRRTYEGGAVEGRSTALRTGLSKVAEVGARYLELTSAEAAPFPYAGDSGESCTRGGRIVGVRSRGDGATGVVVRADRIAPWVSGLID